MNKENIKIFIIDDHSMFRSGLKLLLGDEAGFIVCGETGSGIEAIEKCPTAKPDIVLLDLSLPDKDGFKVLKSLIQDNSKLKIIVLTMYENVNFLQEAIKFGASGYIIKNAADLDLINAIKVVFRGDVYIHPSMMKKYVESTLKPDSNKNELSSRERDVIKLLAKGFTNKEISLKLEISIKTVETYRLRICDKLSLSTRAELLEYTIQNGLFDMGI